MNQLLGLPVQQLFEFAAKAQAFLVHKAVPQKERQHSTEAGKMFWTLNKH